jgi:hypothetical protein
VRSLSTLVGLRTLNLSRCRELDNVRPLSTLVGLRTLTLSRCRELRDVFFGKYFSRSVPNP